MEIFDLMQTISILKSMKDYQKVFFFESKDGKEFIKSLSCGILCNEEQGKAVSSLLKAVGHPGFNMKGESLEKNIVLGEVGFSIPVEQAIPQDRTAEMKNYPDKRLNSSHVMNAIGATVLQPSQYWTKQSQLCHDFKASPESIEAALFRAVGEGRVAYEKTDKELLFAKI